MIPIEPAADLRQAAATLAELFSALCQAGFTPEQALYLVGEAMRGARSCT